MHYSTLFSALIAASTCVTASPLLRKRAPISTNDTSALQLALFLEHVEFNLYQQGCANLTDAQFTAEGFPVGFHNNVCVIAEQEATHIQAIGNVLRQHGAIPVLPCSYTFPYTNASSFVALANSITSVGIGAYIGGSQALTDASLLEGVSASILSVEARHSTYLRTGLNASVFPTAFDTDLSSLWAYNLALKYVSTCSNATKLPGLSRLPQLNVTEIPTLNISAPAILNHTMGPPYLNTTIGRLSLNTTTPVNVSLAVPAAPALPATTLQLSWNPSQINASMLTPLYLAMVNQNVSATIFTPLQNVSRMLGIGSVVVPPSVDGVVYAALTAYGSNLTLDQLSTYGTLAGPVEIVVS